MSADHPADDSMEDILKSCGKPGEPDYHNNMGNLERLKGNVESAIKEYREAVRLKPDDAMFHCNLGIALAQAEKDEEALGEYKEAIRLEPGDYPSFFSMGNLLSKLERDEEAMAAYVKAIALAPERCEAHYNLANMLRRLDRWEEAVPHYEGALVDPANPEVAVNSHLLLGVHFVGQERWVDAEPHLLEVVAKRPDDFLANYGLGVLYLNRAAQGEQGQELWRKAAKYAQKAADLEPKDEDAQRWAMLARKGVEQGGK